MTLVAQHFDGVEGMLEHARSGLARIGPLSAYAEVRAGEALLVDIRPAAQRAAEGEVHPDLGGLVIERNVLEWRLDPRSDACLREASLDARVVVLCQEGYTSSLAAYALQQLGIHRATDIVGGFKAWRDADLPVADGTA